MYKKMDCLVQIFIFPFLFTTLACSTLINASLHFQPEYRYNELPEAGSEDAVGWAVGEHGDTCEIWNTTT